MVRAGDAGVAESGLRPDARMVLVGATGLEPAAFASRTRRSTRLSYAPKVWWTGLDSNQRCQKATDLQSAGLSHSPTCPNFAALAACACGQVNWCGRGDSNSYGLSPTSTSSWRVYRSATAANLSRRRTAGISLPEVVRAGGLEPPRLGRQVLSPVRLPIPPDPQTQGRRWCERQGSNLHSRGHQNLNLACLPIPPRSQNQLVGARGFEPPALCPQSRCATRLRYAPTLWCGRPDLNRHGISPGEV